VHHERQITLEEHGQSLSFAITCVWPSKKPAAMFARARQILDDASMPVICPTSQIKEGVTKVVWQIETDIWLFTQRKQ
jgi:hypothetical protein